MLVPATSAIIQAMSFSRQEPVAITGIGLICRRVPSVLSSDSASKPARFTPVEIPRPPIEFDRMSHDATAASRAIALAFGAVVEATHPYKFRTTNTGVAITVSKGLTDVLENAVSNLKTSNVDKIPTISECGPDAAARWIARVLKMDGPASAAVAACASGLASIKLAMDWLRDSVCETVWAGAAESSNSPMILSSFERLGVISPTGQTRPFDARRDGFVVGEGAAVFCIESFASAKVRAQRQTGPAILGQILGMAFGADAHHLTTPDATGAVLIGVIECALLRAGIDPGEIGWIHAHGTATAYNDPVEIKVLRKVFGKSIPPVTATKGTTGHLLGASGAVALGLTLDALRKRFIPHVEGLREPAKEFAGIDFVLGARRASTAKTALVLNHGFGGHIAAAVVSI